MDKLEDEKLQSPDIVDDVGGVSPDYFEKLHLERVQKARIQEQEKITRLYSTTARIGRIESQAQAV